MCKTSNCGGLARLGLSEFAEHEKFVTHWKREGSQGQVLRSDCSDAGMAKGLRAKSVEILLSPGREAPWGESLRPVASLLRCG